MTTIDEHKKIVKNLFKIKDMVESILGEEL